MADVTPNLDLPFIAAGQAGKHITHNEALRILDALAVLTVKNRTLSTPPSSPAEGDRHLVAASPTGGWAGQAGKLAAWQDGAWAFFAPKTGWRAWVADEARLIAFDGAAWVAVAPAPNPTPLVGVNATADTTNRLSVTSPAALFRHDGAGCQLKIDKAAAGETGSLLFQSGASGRAEIGLTGDNRLHVKASADGTVWKDLIVVDAANDRVQLPLSSGALRIDALTAGAVAYADTNKDLKASAGFAFNAAINQLTLSGGSSVSPLVLSTPAVSSNLQFVCGTSPTRSCVVALDASGNMIIQTDAAAGGLYLDSFGGVFLRTRTGTLFATIATNGRPDFTGDTLRLRTARTPASATAAGAAGDICWDASFVYVCVATNSWKRAAIAAW
jgi:hypothetical protein